ncbi:hypothetical protein VD0002_g5823 [Verticillium dahliae]|uniref:Uncharacterized protein n=1 Tax=Verticillium dahliae TaxID=27337 RepID=A0AA44WQ44_VERDA|nr:hypothetical protein VdG2_05955 [Verticillium dahliae VDG2]KAH6708413.1 hypothetical protein EV126DRAFT_511448 [Verticillium dahliae]PNH35075.1 hypothetical protein BJF96_g1859 [Verticillium dahliae]PNH41948.1 hypothetical protein VD0004_g5276 [Verticillium dahliae]PNH49898.1 hypothetical protein VD0003_g7270 [Verticillium dahliae]
MPERRHAGEKMEGEYHQANFRFVAPTSGTPSDIFLVSAPFDVEDSVGDSAPQLRQLSDGLDL